MDYSDIADFKDRENYFKNIFHKAASVCIQDYDANKIGDEEKECLKKASLKLHYIVNDSRLERWALNPEERPYEEYFWIRSKI